MPWLGAEHGAPPDENWNLLSGFMADQAPGRAVGRLPPVSAPSQLATRGPIPRVTARRGPRGYFLLVALVVVLALGFVWLAAYYYGAHVAYRLGLVEAQDAVITAREFQPGKPSFGRGGLDGCDRVELAFALEGGSGAYAACSYETRLYYLAVGDQLEVAAVPWSREVFPVGGATVWDLVTVPVILLAAALALWWAARRTVSMLGLMRGVATARPMTGSFQVTGNRNIVSVSLDPADGEDGEDAARRLVLLLLHRGGVRAIGPATIWGTRRTVLRRRPCGPWVVQPSSDQVFVAPGAAGRRRRRARKVPQSVESAGGRGQDEASTN